MCTVTFLPTGDAQFILTSNRDEAITRPPSIEPALYYHNNKKIIYPKDRLAGGTWIGISEESRLICLLNGAFKTHQRKESYRMSRGVVVKDALACEEILPFLKNYNLHNVEPFTLVIVEWKEKLDLWEFRWDGSMKYITKKVNRPGIWSSATLYIPEMVEKREAWFEKWKNSNPDFKPDQIREFHKTAGEGNPISNLMTERGFLKTISTTSVERNSGKELKIIYEDYLSGKVTEMNLKSLKEKPEVEFPAEV